MSAIQSNTTGAADVALGRFLLERPFPFDASGASTAIARAADIALVIDRAGLIVDVAISTPVFARLGVSLWIGKSFADVVTVESRTKLPSLLTGALNGVRRWHQLNHPDGDLDLPVEYAAVAVGEDDARILAGRELSAVAALQQRLVAAQVEVDREYSRLRASEQRYRVLFRVASEAVVIAEAATERVVEANPAAAELFDAKSSRLPGLALASLFDPADGTALAALVAAARGGAAPGEAELRSAGGRPLRVGLSGFLQARASYLLLRAGPRADAPSARTGGIDTAAVLERMPEGFVVCDEAGRVLFANPAFVELTQSPSIEQIRGLPLGMWLGRTGVDVDLLLGTLRQHGAMRSFATVLRGSLGTDEEVEIAGVAVPPGTGKAHFGLTVRIVRARVATAVGTLERSVERMTELVGRVPLRELVRETTDMIERLCIDAALRLAENNRVTAAEMLGLSRQSLYVKMRRFGQIRPGEDDALS